MVRFLLTDTSSRYFNHNGRLRLVKYDQHGPGCVRHHRDPQAAAQAEAALSQRARISTTPFPVRANWLVVRPYSTEPARALAELHYTLREPCHEALLRRQPANDPAGAPPFSCIALYNQNFHRVRLQPPFLFPRYHHF